MQIGEARTSPEAGKRGGKGQTGEWGCTVVVEEGTGAQGEVSRAGHVPTGCWGRAGGQGAAGCSDEGGGGREGARVSGHCSGVDGGLDVARRGGGFSRLSFGAMLGGRVG